MLALADTHNRPVFTPITGERSRAYHFPGGDELIFLNVTGLCVRDSGHRLELADGLKVIIPNGWIAISIDADEWCA